MTWWDSFIEADLQLLWEIQDWVYRRPWLDSRMARIVSKHPWQDICAVPWLLCALGVYELGFRHFWVVGVNLAGAYVLRQAVQGKRPLEYDSRLQPMTDLHADSFGLPSLETHMSTVILLHFALTLAARAGGGLLMHVATLMPALLLCALVGFSRVYARSRFPHQVALSWLSGAVGLALGACVCTCLFSSSISAVQCTNFISLPSSNSPYLGPLSQVDCAATAFGSTRCTGEGHD